MLLVGFGDPKAHNPHVSLLGYETPIISSMALPYFRREICPTHLKNLRSVQGS
jgi:hypothetical protein